MVDELKEIEKTLEQLSKDLDTQMSAYSLDNDKFHENLIELMGKYPEYKELIQFIVSINDRLVTTHIISRDIFYETIKSLIHQKRILVKKLFRDYEEKAKPKESKFDKTIEFFKNNKTVLITIAISVTFTLLMVGIMMVPAETLEALKLLKGMSGK